MDGIFKVPNASVPMMVELGYTTTAPYGDSTTHTKVSVHANIGDTYPLPMSEYLLDTITYIYNTNKDIYKFIRIDEGSYYIVIEVRSLQANMFGYLRGITRKIYRNDTDATHKYIDNLSARYKKYSTIVVEKINKDIYRSEQEKRIGFNVLNTYKYKGPKLSIHYISDIDNTIHISHSLSFYQIKYDEACIYLDNYRTILDKIKEVEGKTIESIPDNFLNYE